MNTGTILWLISSLLLTGWGKVNQPCCKNFNPVLVHRLGPGDPLFGHVQGLEINDDYFFLTAVSLNQESGFLYIYPRTGAIGRAPIHRYDLWELARRRASACGPLDDGPLNHPSGIHLWGTLLNVAIAPSANRGPTCVLTLDMKDPANPDVVRAVRIDDHVGAVVQLSEKTRMGYNWGSEDYWWLELESPPRRVSVREVLGGRLAEKLHIQDCDLENKTLYCAHNDNEQDNLVKIYAAASFGPEGSTLKPLTITLPPLGSAHGGTHEGIAWHEGSLFLLPDDGNESGVMIYELGCLCEHQDVCATKE